MKPDEPIVPKELGHHTPEQIAKAFAYAPKVLAKLVERGYPLVSFQLFEDASGRLILGMVSDFALDDGRSGIPKEDWEFACSLVKSRRPIMDSSGQAGVQFCCGLVLAAEEEEKEELLPPRSRRGL